MSLIRAIIDHIVQDCPPEMEACQDCREPHCTQARAETCQWRLVAMAERTAEGEARI